MYLRTLIFPNIFPLSFIFCWVTLQLFTFIIFIFCMVDKYYIFSNVRDSNFTITKLKAITEI